jgi:hypothetical protein
VSAATKAKLALAWLGCAVFAIPLIAHAYAGSASRYFGDDFCASAVFRDHGLVGGQRWFYMNWGAVPTTLLLMALTHPAGVRLTRILPAIALVAWVAAAAWAVRRMTEQLGDRFDVASSLLLAELIVYATLADSPNVIQSLYLRVPMFEYVGPLIGLMFYAGFLARGAARPSAAPGAMVTSGAIAFVTGSFGPTYVALQTTAVALAILVAWAVDRSDRSRTLRQLLIAGLTGSLASLVFIAVAPGNTIRQHSFQSSPTVFGIVKWSLLSTFFMFARPLLPLLHGAIVASVPRVSAETPVWLGKALDMAASPLTPVLLVGVSASVAFTRGTSTAGDRRHARLALIGIPIVAFVFIMACMAPSVYGTSAPPPPRALIIPQFALVCLTVCWGYALGVWARAFSASGRRFMPPVVAAIACAAVWASLASARATVREGVALRQWAVRWDETDRLLRAEHARGRRHAVVPAVDSIGGVGSIGRNPNDWVNWCAARYYDFDTITGVTARP